VIRCACGFVRVGSGRIAAGCLAFERFIFTEVDVRKLSVWSLALVTGVCCAVVACGSDDDSGIASGGATGIAGKAGTAGKAGLGEGGTTAAAGAAGAAGAVGEAGAPAVDSLYTRLGGHAGIAAAIGLIVTAELGDPDIASYFAPNLKVPSHAPSAADIEECFTNLLGNAAGGPEAYPMTTAGGFTCRSMPAAHAALHIGSTTFDNFVTIAGGVLKTAKVADDDIATVASVLIGTKSAIVDSAAPKSGPCIVAACKVGEAGAGGTAGN